jgi:DHA1 family solute carrier family 18 vesicular amine transporter 1/2
MIKTTVTPQARRNYYFIVFSVISMQITASTIYMVFPLFFEAHGLTKGDSGLLISIGTFAGILSSVAAGIFSNRFGRKKILFLGTVLYTCVFFLFNYAGGSFRLLMALRFVEGLGFYVMPVMVTTMAADIFPSGERGRAMGLFSSAGGVGSLIGPLISPLLISGNDYTTYFRFSGGFVAVSAVAMLLLVKETLPKEKLQVVNTSSKGFRIDVPGFLRSVRGLGAVVGIFLVAILVYRTGLTMIDPFLSLFMQDVKHIQLFQMSFVFAAKALATIIFAPLAGILVDRSGKKITILLGIIMSIVTLIGYTLPGGFLWMVALNSLYGMTWAVIMTAMNTLMADLLSPEMRGFGLGLQSAISQQSSTIGSLFSGFIIDAYGFNFVFYLAAGFCVVTLTLIQLFVPEQRNHVAVEWEAEIPH